MDDWIAAYQRHLASSAGISPAVQRRRLLWAQRWTDHLGGRELGEATPAEVDGFLARIAEHASPATVCQAIAAAEYLYGWALSQRPPLADYSPWLLVRRPRQVRPLPRILTVDQVRRLLATFDRPTYHDALSSALANLLYSTGARISEICTADVGHLELEAGRLLLEGKGGRQRYAPVLPPAAEALARYLRWTAGYHRRGGRALLVGPRGGRLSRRTALELIQDGASRARLNMRAYPHLLRHSIATHLIEGGADLRTVQEFLGHAKIQTTEIYLHVATRHLRAAVERAHPLATGEGVPDAGVRAAAIG